MKKSIINGIIMFILFLAFSVIIYLIISFGQLSINPLLWKTEARIATSSILSVAFIFHIIATIIINTSND